jgi:sugar phosphate isomerase/epimerase
MSQITTPSWSFERDVEAFVTAGVDGIGVSLAKVATCGLARAVRLLQDAALSVSCVTSSGRFPLGDEAGERTALTRARADVRVAAELGAANLLVLSGNTPRLTWDEAAARARPLFEELAREAERAGVRLALEPTSQLRMDLSFLHGFGEALDFVDGIESPWLGVVLEVNNAWIERRLYDDIRVRTDRIALVQVSDFKVGTLTANERVVPGDGDIPLERIARALAAAGYDGWYDVELLGRAIEHEGYASVVPRALARVRALFP